MTMRPRKIIYDRTAGVLRDAEGTEIANQDLFPSSTLGMKPIVNLQVVTDAELIGYTGWAAGALANILIDNDFSNYAPLINLESGDGNWTAGTGSEYYYEESVDILAEPSSVWINDSEATAGTVGSLAAGEWGWDANDERLYVRLADDSDPDAQSDGYVQYKPDATVTKPFVEVDADTLQASGSWYDTDTETFRDPDITAGELSFVLNCNTAQFYNRLGIQSNAFCTMQIQILESGTSAFVDMVEMSFIARNRYLPSGAELEVEITNYYTKAEADAKFLLASTASDVTVTSSDSGLILTSPDGTRFRMTVDNDGIPTFAEVA